MVLIPCHGPYFQDCPATLVFLLFLHGVRHPSTLGAFAEVFPCAWTSLARNIYMAHSSLSLGPHVASRRTFLTTWNPPSIPRNPSSPSLLFLLEHITFSNRLCYLHVHLTVFSLLEYRRSVPWTAACTFGCSVGKGAQGVRTQWNTVPAPIRDSDLTHWESKPIMQQNNETVCLIQLLFVIMKHPKVWI